MKMVPNDTLEMRDEVLVYDDYFGPKSGTKLADFIEDHKGWIELFWVPFNENIWMKSWKPTTREPDPPNILGPILDGLGAIFTNVVYSLHEPPSWLKSTLIPWFLKNVIFANMICGFKNAPRTSYLSRYNALHWRTHIDDWITEDIEFALPVTINGVDNYENVKVAFNIIRDAVAVFQERNLYPMDLIAEVRFISGGSSLLNPAYGDSNEKWMFIEFLRSGIYFRPEHTKREWREFLNYVSLQWIKQFGKLARPHWAKGFQDIKGINDHIPTCFPKFDKFREIRNQYDPKGLFLNPFFRELFKFE
jgi:hypothetical protein